MRISEHRTVIPNAGAGKEQIAMTLPTLDRRVLAEVVSRVVVKIYPAGQMIIKQGDTSDRFFMVVKGELDVEVAAAGVPPRIVNRLGAGDYFGEIGLLTGAVRNATVRTTRETELMELDRDGFMTMITECDLTSQELSRVMRQRVIATGLALALPALSPTQAAALVSRVQHRRYSAGSNIVRQGDPADAFYVLLKGECQVLCRGPNSGDAIVGELVQGDFFGEIGLLLGVPRTATVRAGPHADAEVLALDAEGFRTVIHQAKLAYEEIALVMRSRLARHHAR